MGIGNDILMIKTKFFDAFSLEQHRLECLYINFSIDHEQETVFIKSTGLQKFNEAQTVI